MSDFSILLVMPGALCLLFAGLEHRDAKRRNGRG